MGIQIPEPLKTVQKLLFSMSIRTVYEKHYKALLIFPVLLLLFAIGQISWQYSTTGDFLFRDVSLKGGITLTLPLSEDFSIVDVSNALNEKFPNHDVQVRALKQNGEVTAAIIDADIEQNQVTDLLSAAESIFSKKWKDGEYSVEIFGSSLGQSFFKQTIIAVIVAFFCMGVVVFFYFKSPIPSAAVMLAAFSDMIATIAIMNVLGTRISTAGIAAYLMLIGYSIDTDILLTTRVLKRKQGTVMDQVYSSLKTGVMMNATALAAVTTALLISTSSTISQIMLILIVGILCDLVNTWIQNVAILRWHLEGKEQHE